MKSTYLHLFFILFVFSSFFADAQYVKNQSLSEASASFIAEASYDWAGASLSFIGDVNVDGLDDMLIGAPWWNEEQGIVGRGECYLIYGRSSANWGQNFSLSLADASFVGEATEDWAGRHIERVGLGDVNGDDVDDFLVTAYTRYSMTGEVYLFFGNPHPDWIKGYNLGSADASFIGEATADGFGIGTSRIGDVNGDGLNDFLIGAPWNDFIDDETGKTYLIFGATDGWSLRKSILNADASIYGSTPGSHSGHSVSGVGDVNGDGYDDFLIGSPQLSLVEPGYAYLFLGKPDGWETNMSLESANASFKGTNIGDTAGQQVTGVGDVNGDGLDDFLIAAVQAGSGTCYLVLGRAEADWGHLFPLSEADASLVGENPGAWMGSSIAAASDVNGDGYDDFIIGAPATDYLGTENSGKTYLILGRATGWSLKSKISTMADASYLGILENETSGGNVSGGADVNGDGLYDILIGAPYESSIGPNSGKAYLILGQEGVPETLSKPVGLETESSADSIQLNWTPNPEPHLAGYDLYRSDSMSITTAVKINSTTITEPNYIDTSILPETTYYYWVVAIGTSGQRSDYSQPASAMADSVKLWLPDVRGAAGATAELPVNLRYVTGFLEDRLNLTVAYDENLLSPQKVENAILTNAFTSIQSSFLTPGQVEIYAASNTGISSSGEGMLFSIIFDVTSSAVEEATSEFQILSATLMNTMGMAYDLDISDQSVFTVTSSYQWTDVNGDGQNTVTEEDLLVAQEIASGQYSASELQLQSGDLTGDGEINTADVILLMQRESGSPNSSPKKYKSLNQLDSYQISLSKATGYIGDTVRVAVVVDNAREIAGGDLVINYLPSLLKLKNIDFSSATSTGFRLNYSVIPGVIRISLASTSNINQPDGVELLWLDFEILRALVPQTPITFSSVNLYNQSGQNLASYNEISKLPGQVKFSEATSVTNWELYR